MLDLATVFSNLKKQNKIYQKVDYLRAISEIGFLSVVFFDKKTLVRLSGGSDYIVENSFQSSFNLDDYEIVSVSKLKKLKIFKKAFFDDCKHVLQKNIFCDEICIGYLFFKSQQEEEGKLDFNLNQVYFLSEHFENFIKTFETNLRSKNNERLLSNKMLEIESLIGY